MKLASTFWLKMAKISFIFFQLSTISGEKNRPGLKLVISEKILGNKFLKKNQSLCNLEKELFLGAVLAGSYLKHLNVLEDLFECDNG